MSGFSPTGNSPANLSTSMGLSDPRLRRALQHSQLAADNLGFGLKLDSNGRISIDGTKLASDQTTITSIIQSFKNIVNNVDNSTTNVDNSVGDVDNSTTNNYNVSTDILNDLLWGTEMGTAVDLINTAVGLPALWTTGDTAILNRLQFASETLWTPSQTLGDEYGTPGEFILNATGQFWTHNFSLGGSSDKSKTNMVYFASFRVWGILSSQDEALVRLEYVFLDANGAEVSPVKYIRSWAHNENNSAARCTFLVDGVTGSDNLYVAKPAQEMLYALITDTGATGGFGSSHTHGLENDETYDSYSCGAPTGSQIIYLQEPLDDAPASASQVQIRWNCLAETGTSSGGGLEHSYIYAKDQIQYVSKLRDTSGVNYDPLT